MCLLFVYCVKLFVCLSHGQIYYYWENAIQLETLSQPTEWHCSLESVISSLLYRECNPFVMHCLFVIRATMPYPEAEGWGSVLCLNETMFNVQSYGMTVYILVLEK